MSNQHFDVIVVGVGSMGAATCFSLATRGVKVLGLEQFDLVHENGSHAGQSRMVRKAYFEHPDYVPLLEKTYALWSDLEEMAGKKLFHKTGIFYAGPKKNELLEGVKLSAQKYDIPLEHLNEKDCAKRFPSFKLPHDYEYLLEPDAGYVIPEEVVKRYCDLAISKGATILENQRVESWTDVNNTVTLKTRTTTYIAKKIIFTAGGFTQRLLPFLKTRLVTKRQVICWFRPKNPAWFTSDKFPCFLYTTPDLPASFYGFPMLPLGNGSGLMGIKIGYHAPGVAIDPYELHNFDREKESKMIKEFMSVYIPEGFQTVQTVKSCIYTYSDDGDFILENHREHKNVSLACGFSGHGFKFAPLVGEILADLSLEGKTDNPIAFLSSDRFLK